MNGTTEVTYPTVALRLSFGHYTIWDKFYVVDTISKEPLSCPCVGPVLKPFLNKARKLGSPLLHNGYLPGRDPDILLANPHSVALATEGITNLSFAHWLQSNRVIMNFRKFSV